MIEILERFASSPLEILPDSLAAIGITVSMHARWRPPAEARAWGGG